MTDLEALQHAAERYPDDWEAQDRLIRHLEHAGRAPLGQCTYCRCEVLNHHYELHGGGAWIHCNDEDHGCQFLYWGSLLSADFEVWAGPWLGRSKERGPVVGLRT